MKKLLLLILLCISGVTYAEKIQVNISLVEDPDPLEKNVEPKKLMSFGELKNGEYLFTTKQKQEICHSYTGSTIIRDNYLTFKLIITDQGAFLEKLSCVEIKKPK